MRLPHFPRGSVSGVVILLGMLLRVALTPGLLGATFCCAGSVVSAAERSEPKRTYYNLPRGDAASTLRQFALASGRPVFFMMDKVAGEQTNAISGEFSPSEALHRMLAETALAVLQQEGDEEFVVGRRPFVPPEEVGPYKPQPKTEPMIPSTPRGKLRTWLVHLALAATTAATAQQTAGTPAAKAKDDEVVVLSPFTVSATSDVGYGSLMNTSGRLAKAYVDVPQMTNVVTSEFLKDMKRFDTFEALSFVPGVNVEYNFWQATKVRGINSSSGAVNSSSTFIDGFKAPGVFDGSVNDVAFTDRVEVVKGPSPGSFGRGDPAGFINYVTKSPTFRRSTDVEVMVGTGNDHTISQRFVVDTNGLLTDDGQTAYRVVAASSKGAESASFSEYEHNGVLVALKRNLTGRGSVSVKTMVSKDRLPGAFFPSYIFDKDFQAVYYQELEDLGLPLLSYTVRDSNEWLAYNSTHVSSTAFSTSGILEYKLGEHWTTRQAAKFLQSRSDSDHLFNGPLLLAADGTVLSAPIRALGNRAYRSAAYQSDFVGQFKIPVIGCALEVMAGGDYSFVVSKSATDYSFNNAQPLDSWNPFVSLPGSSINPDQKYYRETRDDRSVYTQVEARFWHERLRFTAAGRKNYTELKSVDTVYGGRTDSKTKSPMLPAYSALFKLNEALSVYALYSQYIEPPFTRSKYGVSYPDSDPRAHEIVVFQPDTQLKEFGIKGNLLAGRFGFSVCVYDVKQTGTPVPAQFADSAVATGDGIASYVFPSFTEAKGIEFESFGKITRNLTFMLNGAYILSSERVGAFTPPGQSSVVTHFSLPSNPNTLAGYFTYSFTGDRQRGLSLTAGWKTIFSGWQMTQYSGRDNRYPHTKNIVDLGLSYGLNERWDFYLKGNNVLESGLIPTGHAGFISGRKVVAGVTAHF